MARRNSDRSGMEPHVPEQAEAPPAGAMAGNTGGGLNFVVPTEFVDLPSKGLWYPEGHPLKDEEVLEMRYMTAKEEDILTSPALLKKGLAVDRVLQNLIVDDRIKIADILLGDKAAMILSARIAAYGADYMATVTCPACGSKVEHYFDLNLHEAYHPSEEKLEEWSISKTDNGTFKVKLPRSEVELELRLMTSRDEHHFIQTAQKRKKHKLPETPTTDILKRVIVSANGSTDTLALGKFVENMPAYDSRFLRNALKVLTPSVDNEQEFLCNNCGYDQDMEVPFGTEFFWPRQ